MTSMATQDNMIASASATVEDLGPWFGALRFRYFGRRPLIEDNSVTSKPTTLVDLRVGYKFSDQARFWLDILNLFDNTGAHRSRTRATINKLANHRSVTWRVPRPLISICPRSSVTK
jgi:hypothetical protein